MMKKIIALALVIVMCLSFAACNGGEKQNTDNTVDIKDCVIGTWERNFTTSDNEEVKQVIEIYKGGTGKFLIYSDTNGSFQATWEIEDDVLNVTYGDSVTLGLILDADVQPMTLTRVDDNSATFTKIS